MPSAAMAPWPIAVVSRCGRITSPPANDAGLGPHLVVPVGGDAGPCRCRTPPSPVSRRPGRSPRRSGRPGCPPRCLDILDLERPPTIFASQRLTRRPVARPVRALDHRTGIQPPGSAMPSACAARPRGGSPASCRSRRRWSATSAPWRRPRCRRRRARAGRRSRLREVGRLLNCRCGRGGADGGDVDRGVAAADHDDALADVAQRPSLKALRKAVAVTTFGASPSGRQRRRPARRGRGTRRRTRRGSGSIVMSVPTRCPARLDAEVEDALDLGVEDLARRAEAGMP